MPNSGTGGSEGDSSTDEKLRKSLKPDPSAEQVIEAILETYHQDAKIVKELESYDDRNYLIEMGSSKYLCKVYNGVESAQYAKCSAEESSGSDPKVLSPIHLYSLIWNHLNQPRYSIKTSSPLPIPGRTIEPHVSMHSLPVTSKEHTPSRLCLQLLEWVEGSTMASCHAIPIETLVDAGQYLGKVCIALDDLTSNNPTAKLTADRYHAWDGKNTLDIQDFVECIDNEERRALVQSVLNSFKRDLIANPNKPNFRMGILQGDFNDANIILSDGKVSGVIDFGDTTLR